MKSNIFDAADRRAVDPDWFTGEVWMQVLSKRIKSKEQDIYHVHFQDGARTKLHRHSGAQVLIVTGGSGSLDTYRRYGSRPEFAIRKTSTVRLGRGDIVRIPPGSLHTHGSVSDAKEFTHIAINVLPSEDAAYETEWFESDYKTRARRMQ